MFNIFSRRNAGTESPLVGIKNVERRRSSSHAAKHRLPTRPTPEARPCQPLSTASRHHTPPRPLRAPRRPAAGLRREGIAGPRLGGRRQGRGRGRGRRRCLSETAAEPRCQRIGRRSAPTLGEWAGRGRAVFNPEVGGEKDLKCWIRPPQLLTTATPTSHTINSGG